MKNEIYSKIFMWMFVGLALTFGIAYYTSTNVDALSMIFGKGMYIVFAIVEIVLAIFLGVRVTKMKPTTAKFCYLLYACLTGLTFSAIFVAYKIASILFVFGITAVLFLVFAILGKTTKMDLSKLGTYLFMMLMGVIICSIINIFLQSEGFNLGITIVSLLIFLGYIAFDMQKIKRLEDVVPEENLAILGAFELYLDFINVFIDLLRLFGDNK